MRLRVERERLVQTLLLLSSTLLAEQVTDHRAEWRARLASPTLDVGVDIFRQADVDLAETSRRGSAYGRHRNTSLGITHYSPPVAPRQGPVLVRPGGPKDQIRVKAASQRVRQVMDRLVTEGTAVAGSDGTIHTLFPVAVSAAEGEALREWVTREGAVRTIEIGLGYAISTLFICEGLITNGDAAARHVAIDPHQATRFAGCGLQSLDEAGVGEMVEYHDQGSQIVLPRFLSEERAFDLAFVDGDHRFDGVFLDLVYLGRLVHPGGIVILDDYQLPAVARAASFFLTNLGWTLEEVSAEDALHQWAVLRTSHVPDTGQFDSYVAF